MKTKKVKQVLGVNFSSSDSTMSVNLEIGENGNFIIPANKKELCLDDIKVEFKDKNGDTVIKNM